MAQIIFCPNLYAAKRKFRTRVSILDQKLGFTSEQIRKRYRFDKEQITWLTEELAPQLTSKQSMGKHSIDPETMIKCTLRILASGAHFNCIADATGMGKGSVCRTFWRTVAAICTLAPRLINMPTTELEINKTNAAFAEIANFSNILGAVDGTLIRIKRPPIGREQASVSRKGYHSLNGSNCMLRAITNYKYCGKISRFST